MDLLKNLFIPKDGFFTNWLDSIKDSISQKFNFDSYIDLMNGLRNVSANGTSISVDGLSISGVTVNNMEVIKFGLYDKWKPILFTYIRGFFYILLVIFNVRQVIWLIRGSSGSSGSKGGE